MLGLADILLAALLVVVVIAWVAMDIRGQKSFG